MKNLSDILLQHFHEGDTLYSPLCGTIYLSKISTKGIICSKESLEITFDIYGRHMRDGECVLFPDKRKNWNQYKTDLKIGTKVVFKEHIGSPWTLGIYMGHHSINTRELSDLSTVTLAYHIVPINSFDFSSFSYKHKNDYGTASKSVYYQDSSCTTC